MVALEARLGVAIASKEEKDREEKEEEEEEDFDPFGSDEVCEYEVVWCVLVN